jgi:hypothetical protein
VNERLPRVSAQKKLRFITACRSDSGGTAPTPLQRNVIAISTMMVAGASAVLNSAFASPAQL